MSTPCSDCAEYATKRLPTVQRLWREETGRTFSSVRFLAGVHARHLAGLPILGAGR